MGIYRSITYYTAAIQVSEMICSSLKGQYVISHAHTAQCIDSDAESLPGPGG